MTLINSLPTVPSRSSGFSAAQAETFLEALPGFVTETNAALAYFDLRNADASAVTMWVAGDYTKGAVVWSPATGTNYRAKTTHTSATDPSLDSANWGASSGIAAADQAKLNLITVTEPIDLDQAQVRPTRVADGAVSANAVVVRQSDGTVAEVTSSEATFAVGTPDDFSTGTAITNYGSDNVCSLGSGKFLFLTEEGSVLKGTVGTYSGGSWSFGAKTTLVALNVFSSGCTFDRTAGHGVIWVVDTSNNAIAYGFTVSGSTVSVGSSRTVYNSGASGSFVSAAIGDGYVVFAGTNSGKNVYCCTISGTTLGTIGSGTALDSGNSGGMASLVYLGSNLFAVAWNEVTTDDYNVALVTRSGTNLSVNDAVELFSGSTNPAEQLCLGKLEDGVLVCTYYNHSTAKDYVVAIPYSGTSFGTLGAPLDLATSYSDSYGSKIEIGSAGDNFYIAGRRSSDSYPILFEVSYSGLTLTLESTNVLIASAHFGFGGFAFDLTANIGVVAASNSDPAGVAIPFTMASLTTDAGEWLTIAAGSAADTEDVPIYKVGDLVTGLTGLTYGEDVYIDTDGSLTHSVTIYGKIGLALSATTMLVTEVNA